MKLIVGLGNPGLQYANTRHNVGFMCIDEIVKSLGCEFNKNKFNGLYAEKIINGEKIFFLKPQMFINLSGDVIKKYIDFYKINIGDLLIINDDLDMPVGKIKIKTKGSSGGHNGLKNIESNLKTSEYKRIKIGISNNKMIDTKDYVLGKFDSNDKKIINDVVNKMPDIFNDYINLSFDKLMNKYNVK